MNTPELVAQLEECLRLAKRKISEPDKEMFKNARGALSAELNTLLQEALDMKWPFVEEKWQYKRSLASEDKVNTAELIGGHLPQLMVILRSSIMAAEPSWAISVVFLMDRFLYWIDGSHTLLKIAKALHTRYPETPIAPQIVIRQARVYLNSGKLLKAEYILSSLITNKGATGCWKYQRECDEVLVQSVSVQVRGQALQKLGLWPEAAELIWASLVGFHLLPLPDKKGIGTALGLLANSLISMNDEDFAAFQKRPHINLAFLGDCSHRLLCAAQAAKMAAVYSQFSSLYVLTHMVTRGTCFLSYSFSKDCPAQAKRAYLASAREAFENGLRTKKEHEVVTSQQELHTLLKAAHGLATAHKWLFGPTEQVTAAGRACHKALAPFYLYCFKDDADKNVLSSEVMANLRRVEALLQTTAHKNSDPRSFIPDSYREIKERPPAPFSADDFAKVMECFRKHHDSACQAFPARKRAGGGEHACHVNCITAVRTRPRPLVTASCKSRSFQQATEKAEPEPEISAQPAESVPDSTGGEGRKPREKALRSVIKSGGSSSLGSSWASLSDNCASSPVLVDPFCCTDEDDDGGLGTQSRNNNGERNGAESANASKDAGKDIGAQGSASRPMRDMHGDDAGTGDGGRVSAGDGSQACALCTTSGSEENSTTNQFDGKDKYARTSSGSISSLGSSWQSVSFAKSPDVADFTEVLESKRTVDQSCDTFASEDGGGPGSSFECLHLGSSASSIPKELFSPSYQRANDGSKAATGGSDPEPPLLSTELDSFEFLQVDQSETPGNAVGANLRIAADLNVSPPAGGKDESGERSTESANNDGCLLNTRCPNGCFQGCRMGSVVLTEQDYRSLLSGVCHGCLLRRLPDRPFKLRDHNKPYSALVLKYSKITDSWTACDTIVYVGEVLKMTVEGRQRQAFRVQYLHQELMLGSYVGKEYLKEKKIDAHLGDVERQMTAQFYVMEFNKRLYEHNVATQIFYLPSELLLLLKSDTILACISAEPFMQGEFVKLTNNTTKINSHHSTTEHGVAFGHFTYELSGGQEVVVDLQGWTTANGKGLMYLTDPQIHTLRKPRSADNFHLHGIRKFLEDQHGTHCNGICKKAALQALPLQKDR